MLTEIKTEFIHYRKSRRLLNNIYIKIYLLRNNFWPIIFIIIITYMGWCVALLSQHYFTHTTMTSLLTLFKNTDVVFAYSKEQSVICYIGYMYLSLIFYYILTSVHVVLRVNCPVRHKIFWLIGKFIIAGIFAFGCMQILSYSCLEPSYISNYIHTKTVLGRGWDYKVGSGLLFLKGFIIVGSIGKNNMLEVIKKYSPESQIIGEETLTKIKLDSEVHKKLLETCSSEELLYLGISKGINFF
jgi:hypothetical protein